MAKFTARRGIDMDYFGLRLRAEAGEEVRIPDALFPVFRDDFGHLVAAWITQDETTAAASGGPHTHAESDVTNLTSDLGGKAATGHTHDYSASFSALVHTHAESAIAGLVSDLAGKAASVHSHAESQITSLVSDLAGKAATGHTHSYAATIHSHVDSDLPAGIARDTEVTAAIVAHEATANHGGTGTSIPSGIIAMWGGFVADIPTGWVLCDGLNGTPDLRGRFIKGAAAGADPGATGGSATHTHGNHTVGAISATATGAVKIGTSGASAAAQTHTHAAPSITAHDSVSKEPAYYALCFIQKV